jgi:hypothetical protein
VSGHVEQSGADDRQLEAVAFHDVKEVADRLLAEGMGSPTVLNALSSVALEIIARERGQAAAAAWFRGVANLIGRSAATSPANPGSEE